MTAPDKIWIHGYGGNWSPVSGGTQDIEYTRSDLSQAQVAAAYEDAAGIANSLLVRSKFGTGNTETQCVYSDFVGASIISAIPADATAAMQAMIDKAVGEERERCAQVCDAVSLAAHLATGLAGDDEITTRVGAASYARAAEHIAAGIRKGAKP
jgi:hypothetical protein